MLCVILHFLCKRIHPSPHTGTSVGRAWVRGEGGEGGQGERERRKGREKEGEKERREGREKKREGRGGRKREKGGEGDRGRRGERKREKGGEGERERREGRGGEGRGEYGSGGRNNTLIMYCTCTFLNTLRTMHTCTCTKVHINMSQKGTVHVMYNVQQSHLRLQCCKCTCIHVHVCTFACFFLSSFSHLSLKHVCILIRPPCTCMYM